MHENVSYDSISNVRENERLLQSMRQPEPGEADYDIYRMRCSAPKQSSKSETYEPEESSSVKSINVSNKDARDPRLLSQSVSSKQSDRDAPENSQNSQEEPLNSSQSKESVWKKRDMPPVMYADV